MSLTEDKMKKSERAYDVFRLIHKLEEPTPSKVAEELKSSINALRRYFKVLENVELIEYQKKGRKKIYSISWKYLYSYWDGIISDMSTGGRVISTMGNMNFFGIHEPEYLNEFLRVKQSIQTEGKCNHFFDNEFMRDYFENYLMENENSTLENMFLHDFVDGARMARFNLPRVPGQSLSEFDYDKILLIMSSLILETFYIDKYGSERSHSFLSTLENSEKVWDRKDNSRILFNRWKKYDESVYEIEDLHYPKTVDKLPGLDISEYSIEEHQFDDIPKLFHQNDN